MSAAALRSNRAVERRAAPRSPEADEFPMTQGDFERVRSLIHRHAGITLSEGKRAMVYSRLSRRHFRASYYFETHRHVP